MSRHDREESDRSPSGSMKQVGCGTEQSVPHNDLSNFLKLKEEVVKCPQSYFRRHAQAIICTLGPYHEAVKCLSAFGDQAQKFTAKILDIVEWGTQHWKLKESFLVPVVPKWLRTLEFIQTTMPVQGELPLVPLGTHYEDILLRYTAVVLDGRAPAILAGSHDQLSVWQLLLPGERPSQYPDLGHQHVDAPLHMIQMDLCGETCLPVAQHTGSICGRALGRMGSPKAPYDRPQRPGVRYRSSLQGPCHQEAGRQGMC